MGNAQGGGGARHAAIKRQEGRAQAVGGGDVDGVGRSQHNVTAADESRCRIDIR